MRTCAFNLAVPAVSFSESRGRKLGSRVPSSESTSLSSNDILVACPREKPRDRNYRKPESARTENAGLCRMRDWRGTFEAEGPRCAFVSSICLALHSSGWRVSCSGFVSSRPNFDRETESRLNKDASFKEISKFQDSSLSKQRPRAWNPLSFAKVLTTDSCKCHAKCCTPGRKSLDGRNKSLILIYEVIYGMINLRIFLSSFFSSVVTLDALLLKVLQSMHSNSHLSTCEHTSAKYVIAELTNSTMAHTHARVSFDD